MKHAIILRVPLASCVRRLGESFDLPSPDFVRRLDTDERIAMPLEPGPLHGSTTFGKEHWMQSAAKIVDIRQHGGDTLDIKLFHESFPEVAEGGAYPICVDDDPPKWKKERDAEITAMFSAWNQKREPVAGGA